jgi:hypothetical protein
VINLAQPFQAADSGKSHHAFSDPSDSSDPLWEPSPGMVVNLPAKMEDHMSFGKGALLWLIGIPLPIILLLAVFMHH